jgi:cbb3-type cytochrome oxidase maturation protein
MSVIIVLMSASLLVAIIFLIAFLWAVRSDQYEDTYTPSIRILNDEKEKNKLFNK